MQEIGEVLRERRESLGTSLEEIEAVTKIRLRYLKAIEEGQFHEIPGEVYVRGFLRKYAQCLGLDGEKIVEHYRQLLGEDSSDMVPSGKAGDRTEILVVEEYRGRWRVFGILLFLLLLIAGGVIYYFLFYDGLDRGGTPSGNELAAAVPEGEDVGPVPPASTDRSSSDVESDPLEDSDPQPVEPVHGDHGAEQANGVYEVDDPVVEGSDSDQDVDGEAVDGADSDEGENESADRIEETPDTDDSTSEALVEELGDVVAALSESGLGISAAMAGSLRRDSILHELSVEFTAPCWVRATVDGDLVTERTVAAGSVEVWRAFDSIELRLGSAGAATLRYNGELVEHDYRIGQVRTVRVVTEEGRGRVILE